MPVFLMKSLLSIILFILTLFAMFTMFEVFGREEKRYNIEKLKNIHRIDGIIFFLLYLVIAYFCLDFILSTKAEPSPRAALHSVFAITVIILLALKVSFVRFYRQFYNQAKIIGILIGLITLAMIWTSGGYYLLVTKLGAEPYKKVSEVKKGNPEGSKIIVRTDAESVKKGKDLYESKCYFCHDAYGNETLVGPGHKGILKNPLLPVSKKPATPENVAEQIRNPFRDMPSFSYLTEEDVLNLLAFLNTL